MICPYVYKMGVRAQQEGLYDPDIVTAVCTEMEEQTPAKARDLPTGKAPTQKPCGSGLAGGEYGHKLSLPSPRLTLGRPNS